MPTIAGCANNKFCEEGLPAVSLAQTGVVQIRLTVLGDKDRMISWSIMVLMICQKADSDERGEMSSGHLALA